MCIFAEYMECRLSQIKSDHVIQVIWIFIACHFQSCFTVAALKEAPSSMGSTWVSDHWLPQQWPCSWSLNAALETEYTMCVEVTSSDCMFIERVRAFSFRQLKSYVLSLPSQVNRAREGSDRITNSPQSADSCLGIQFVFILFLDAKRKKEEKKNHPTLLFCL